MDVILTGDTLFVGNPAQNRVDIFIYDGADWALSDSFRAPDTNAGDEFGTAMVLYKDRLLVGAPKADGEVLPKSGAAYIFRKTGTQFVFEGKIVPETEQLNSNFGKTMDMDSVPGGRLGIAVGMNFLHVGSYSKAGGVALFYHNGIRWKGGTILTDSYLKTNGQFGVNVQLDSIWLVVSGRNSGFMNTQETRIYKDSLGHFVYYKSITITETSFYQDGRLLRHLTNTIYPTVPELIIPYTFVGELIEEEEGWIVPEQSKWFGFSIGWGENISPNAVIRSGNRIYAGIPNTRSDKLVRSGVVQIHERIETSPGTFEWMLADLIYPNQWHADTAFTSITSFMVTDFGNNVSVSGNYMATAAKLTGDSAAVFVYDLNDRCRAPIVTENILGTASDTFAFIAKWKPMADAINYNFGLIWAVYDNQQLNWTAMTDTFFIMPKSHLPYGEYTWRVQSNCADRQSDYRRKHLFKAPSPCDTVTSLKLENDTLSSDLVLTWEHEPGIRGSQSEYSISYNPGGGPILFAYVPSEKPKSQVVPRPPATETYSYIVRPLCTTVETAKAFTSPHEIGVYPPDGTGISLTPRLSEETWRLFSMDGRLLAEGTGALIALPNGMAAGCYFVRTQEESGIRCWPQ